MVDEALLARLESLDWLDKEVPDIAQRHEMKRAMLGVDEATYQEAVGALAAWERARLLRRGIAVAPPNRLVRDAKGAIGIVKEPPKEK